MFGITFDKDDTIFSEVLVDINLPDMSVFECIKFGKNPAQYLKSYDGVMCSSGGTWQAAVNRAHSIDPQARPYRGADIPMTNVEPIKLKDKVLPAGTKIGHSTSTTNKGNLEKLIKDCQRAGFDLEKDSIRVKIGHEKREKNGNKWGLVTFTVVGLTPEPEETGE